MEQNRNITLVQTTTILISTIIGVGVLRLPLIAVQSADTGAPLLTALAVLFSLFGLWIIIKLGLLFPKQSIIEYSEVIIGKWLGKLYSFFMILFFTILTGLATREFGAVVVSAVLRETPLEVTVLVMLVMAAIYTRDNFNTFAYIHNFYVPAILIPGFIIVITSLSNANFLYLEPVWGNISTQSLTGTLTITALFQGAFIITIIIPVMEKPKKAMRAAIWGVAISGGFFVMMVAAALALFGPEELKKSMWPTLELARATQIPGNLLQRLDIVFLAVWVTAVFTTIYSNYVFTAHALKRFFQLKDHKMMAFFLLPIVFFIAMLPQETFQLYRVISIVGRLGIGITIVVPIVLIVLSKLRKLPKKEKEL
ncbi:GerAB/ArcD/ProY family transporter [Bacillus niameyensis]|uniref:GerAB/ArcD/ProY family transporter n=1 Tax=Bacillus niameyensis TaxID=1522308 RepID=UPI0007861301|nr:endospore germination permease [Bacillus niameyensis]